MKIYLYSSGSNNFKKTELDLQKKNIYYTRLSNNIHTIINKKVGSFERKIFLSKISQILIYGKEKNFKKMKNNIIFNNSVKKVELGESESGKKIYGYYKGNPKKGFFGIFADIHGSYEYGTYKTAEFLLEELGKTNTTGWFIIPTLNPDGLDIAQQDKFHYTSYIEGRNNINIVDINRNFCTENFQLKTFIKNGISLNTGKNKCNSEKETQTVTQILNTYRFNNIISLHSLGGNFFIPDNSIDDKRIIELGNNMKKILPKYDFNISYSTPSEKTHKIFDYEIDEGGSNLFTGTMETYIYEKYNIPVIIIELKKHGKIEYNLQGIKTLLQK